MTKSNMSAYLTKLTIISTIREFFKALDYIELEPPTLNDALIPESYLDIFRTKDRRIKSSTEIVTTDKYLITSPEAFQKKMLALGVGSNFIITKSFRNGEPLSGKHLSEFTLLEWYEKGHNYLDVMNTTEALFNTIAQKLNIKSTITYKDAQITLTPPWIRLSVNEAFQQYTKINISDSWDEVTNEFSLKKLAELAKHLPIKVEEHTTWEELFNQLFLIYVEPNLPTNKPVILYDYPHELSPLAKPKRDPKNGAMYAERFEVMMAGLEICDTYTENTDPALQEVTYAREIASIKAKGKEPYAYDYEFIDALKLGLPACSGNALGVDRMAMIFSGATEIDEVSPAHIWKRHVEENA